MPQDLTCGGDFVADGKAVGRLAPEILLVGGAGSKPPEIFLVGNLVAAGEMQIEQTPAQAGDTVLSPLLPFPDIVGDDLDQFTGACSAPYRLKGEATGLDAARECEAAWGDRTRVLIVSGESSARVIVYDEDVDVQDVSLAMFHALNNVDWARDIIVQEGPVDALDHASYRFAMGGKIGIDATRKWASEGYTREWPEMVEMAAPVQKLVSERWAEYGLKS